MSERIEPQVDPSKYKFGNQVTRDNFLDMVKNSFAVSRGAGLVQYMYIEYLRRKDRLGDWDPEKIDEEDNYDIFSSTELVPLHAAYMRVSPPTGGHDDHPKPHRNFFRECINQSTSYPYGVDTDADKFDLGEKEFMAYLSQLAIIERQKKEMIDNYPNDMK